MNSRNLLLTGLALALLSPAFAQQTEPTTSSNAKPALSTYEEKPPAQVQPHLVDVSNVEAIGDEDVIPTYNKKPNASGDAQKLDLIRYEEANEANDGRGHSELWSETQE